MSAEVIHRIAMFFPVFLFALCFHEYAHGWMAKRLGDDTAERMGRLTMNPMAHIDLFGTIILPLMSIISGWALFGWAKPVPFDPRNLKDPKVGAFWIALAGPLSNVLLALIGAFLFTLTYSGVFGSSPFVVTLLKFFNQFVFFNILLAVFNMIPVHPLDGGKVLARFLPEKVNSFLEEHQGPTSMVLMGFFILGGFKYLAAPMNYLHQMTMGFMAGLFS